MIQLPKLLETVDNCVDWRVGCDEHLRIVAIQSEPPPELDSCADTPGRTSQRGGVVASVTPSSGALIECWFSSDGCNNTCIMRTGRAGEETAIRALPAFATVEELIHICFRVFGEFRRKHMLAYELADWLREHGGSMQEIECTEFAGEAAATGVDPHVWSFYHCTLNDGCETVVGFDDDGRVATFSEVDGLLDGFLDFDRRASETLLVEEFSAWLDETLGTPASPTL